MSVHGVGAAMVLAAGYGTRLRPLTDHVPKSLAPLLDRPLLDHVLERLAAAGVPRAAVNTHHLAEAVAAHLGARRGPPRVSVRHEPEILGTAGPLAASRDLLAADAAFLVHNADVWCEADLAALAAVREREDAEGVLLLVDHPAVNTVRWAAEGTVRDVGGLLGATPRPGDRMLTYTGVAVFARRFLDRIPPGPSSLATALVASAAEGRLLGWAPAGLRWSDLGTPRSYLEAHAELLATGERIRRHPDAAVSADAVLEGFVVLGAGVGVGAGTRLSDCVLLPGAVVPPGAQHHRSVLGPGWVMPEASAAPGVPELPDLSSSLGADVVAEPIAGQASARRFWRLRGSAGRAVMMDASDDPAGFERTVAVSRALHEEGLGGAAVLAADAGRKIAVFEDLGACSLGDALAADPDRGRELYTEALVWVADLQDHVSAAGEGPSALRPPVFDRTHLRAESRYFTERFLLQECGCDPVAVTDLDEELEALAVAVDAQPKALMHRDCQSTNLLLFGGRVRPVDVQDLRWGPIGYDPASLLRDPYVDLPAPMAAELMAVWEGLPRRGRPPGRADDVALAGVQRSLQALGAYAFLSRIRGKRRFREWIPAGLRQLRRGLDGTGHLWDAPRIRRQVEWACRRFGID